MSLVRIVVFQISFNDSGLVIHLSTAAYLGVLLLVSLFVVAVIARFVLGSGIWNRLNALKRGMDLNKVPTTVFLFGFILWALLLVILSTGMIWQVWQTAFGWPAPLNEVAEEIKSRLVLLTALTATLGAIIVFPVTLRRLKLTRQQTRTEEEALFNEKINAAVGDLHSRRQVSVETENPNNGNKKLVDVWKDDVVRRTAAIERLNGLVNERSDAVPRVAGLLCVYLRELSREFPSSSPSHPRADMEKAAQVLGGLRAIEGAQSYKFDIDLRNSNLAGFDLSECNFDEAILTGSDLFETRLRKASLRDTRLDSSDLRKADLRKADLSGAFVRASSFNQSAWSGTVTNGAYVACSNLDNTDIDQAQLDVTYGDPSTRLPEGLHRPVNNKGQQLWPSIEIKEWRQFYDAWRAWQTGIGYTRLNKRPGA